jgi:hypothetical protein
MPECISNHERVICNYKVKSLSLQQGTTKRCIWQNYGYVLMIEFFKQKNVCQILK